MILIAAHCLFAPPSDWEIADPKMPSKRAVVNFVSKKKTGFCPSMNLTHEKVRVPIGAYLKIVERNCLTKKQRWRHLGRIETLSGKAELTEIEVKTNFGDARIFQAILYKGEDIFILTASALKKEFGRYAPSLEKAIRSMRVVDDLFSMVIDESMRDRLRDAWQKRKDGLESIPFEEMVLETGNELGTVWQLQMLKQ